MIGNEPTKWHMNVPLFEQVRYDDLYPGVDLVIGNRRGILEYDLELTDSVNLKDVRVDCEGTESIEVSDVIFCCGYTNGPGSGFDLATGNTKFPTSTVNGGFYSGCENDYYQTNSNGQWDAFLVKLDYTATQQLRYGTLFGGDGAETAYSLARVSGTSAIIVGRTSSGTFIPFPTTTNAYDQTYNGGSFDAFLTRLDWSSGRVGSGQLTYSTLLGGSSDETALSLSLDGSNAYLGGFTFSSDFPTSGSPFDSTFNGGTGATDGFACLLSLPPNP